VAGDRTRDLLIASPTRATIAPPGTPLFSQTLCRSASPQGSVATRSLNALSRRRSFSAAAGKLETTQALVRCSAESNCFRGDGSNYPSLRFLLRRPLLLLMLLMTASDR